MARIPASEIERLKQTVSLQRLVEAAGVELKRHGKDLVGLCPFHDDHEPSLVVTPEKNLWHCLGACQRGGSVIDWVMKRNGLSFRHAVELLRNDPSLAAPVSAAPAKRSVTRRLEAPFTSAASDQDALNQVIGYYHETLKQSPEALAYLDKRGLRSEEAIARFKLGYANRTLAYRLPGSHTKQGAALRGRLQRLGVLRESGHEHFNGSLVVPILDEQGNVLQAYGRKINDALRAGTPRHLYLPGPHQGVWNLEVFKTSKEAILCEALIDALTFWCAGYRNVTASYGVNGFTADHLAVFKQHGTKRVLIAYDRDDAGEKAAKALAQQLTGEGLDCYRIEFPKGMDANDYALHVQPAPKSLGLAIRKSVWLGQGRAPAITTAVDTADLASAALHDVDEPAPELKALDQTLPSSLAAKEVESEAAPLPASPVPEAPSSDVPAEVKDDEVIATLGERRYRVRGLAKNLAFEVMKVNVLASRGDAFHVDTFDLYSSRHRASFIHQAAHELGLKEDVIKKDLARVLLKLESLQEALIHKGKPPALPGDSQRFDLYCGRERVHVTVAKSGTAQQAPFLLPPGEGQDEGGVAPLNANVCTLPSPQPSPGGRGVVALDVLPPLGGSRCYRRL
jgi:DNA primase catalytic core